MRPGILVPICLSLNVAAFCGSAFAHHSASIFASDTTVTVSGTVTEWFWANPHCLLKLDVTSDSGETVQWIGETQAPVSLVESGWRKNMFAIGDEVTMTLRPAKNGAPVGAIVTVELPDGRTLGVRRSREVGDDYHLSGAPTD